MLLPILSSVNSTSVIPRLLQGSRGLCGPINLDRSTDRCVQGYVGSRDWCFVLKQGDQDVLEQANAWRMAVCGVTSGWQAKADKNAATLGIARVQWT